MGWRHSAAAWITSVHEKSADIAEWQADRPVPAASTIKVLIMAACFDRGIEALSERRWIAPENRVSFSLSTEIEDRDHSIYDLIHLMITVSDNAATNELIDWITPEAVNRLAARLGLGGTTLSRKMMDLDAKARGNDNVTTVRDMYRLMEMIRTGALPGSGAMKEILSLNRDRLLFGRFIPESAFLAHKTGLNADCVLDVGFDARRTMAAAWFGPDAEIDGAEWIGRWYREMKDEDSEV